MNEKNKQKTKKQHYVAQSYLRRFTSDGERLFVFDKSRKSAFGPTSVVNVAHENYFYDFHDVEVVTAASTANLDPQSAEKALAVLDGEFNRVLEVAINFANGSTKAPSPKQRMMMSLCAAIQLTRTRDFRDELVKNMEGMASALGENFLRLSKPELAKQLQVEFKFKQDSISLLHGKFLWNPEFIAHVAAALCNHIWVIGLNETANPLLTSDSPVVRQPHKPEQPFVPPPPDSGPLYGRAIDIAIEPTRPGIESEGVELVFPLSPECVLIFLERSHFRSLEDKDGARFALSDSDVDRLNRLQVLQSYRQIYSRSNDFRFVQEVCATHPAACSRQSERTRVKTWERTEDPGLRSERRRVD
jgi:hypothetical protein